jgi:tetratricopeptide (TPR) repeat protein
LAWLQGELAEALHWYRQAFLLDRDDPSVMSRIASAFYEMGMLAEGDYWAMLVRTRNPDACLISMLETESAELAEDYDRLLETVRRGLTIAVSRERFCFAHVDYYLWTMSKLGRSQEAIDFLSELVPGLRNYAIVAGENKNVSYIHAMSAFLHVDLMDAEDFRDMVAGFVNAWYEHNAPINAEENNHAPVYLISMEFGQGNLEAAKTIFLDSYTSMSPWRWKQFLNFPWLKEFRDNPQVAPVVDEYLLSQAVAKKKVREMLKQPEWRKCYGDPQCGA